MNLRMAIAIGAGCIALAGGYWLIQSGTSDEPPRAATRQTDVSTNGKQVGGGTGVSAGKSPTAPTGSVSISSAAPAWAQRSPNDAVRRGASTPSAELPDRGEADAAKQAAVQTALDRLVALQAKERPSPSEVSAAIAQLEDAQGSSVFHGLKLDVLRANLQVGQRMSELAAEFEAMQKRAPGKELTADMMAKLQEMQQLQSKLRTDIAVGNSSDSGGKP